MIGVATDPELIPDDSRGQFKRKSLRMRTVPSAF